MTTYLTPLLRYCLETTAAKLSDEFHGVFSLETVTRYIEASYADLGDRPTVGPNFLPVIIERFAREQLWAVGRLAPRRADRPDRLTAMAEIGLDVSHEFAKPLTDAVIRAADVVVTLGCGDACPVYRGKRYQDWPVDDLAGESLHVVRRIRYELYHHVWDLIETLVPAANLLELQRPTGGQR